MSQQGEHKVRPYMVTVVIIRRKRMGRRFLILAWTLCAFAVVARGQATKDAGEAGVSPFGISASEEYAKLVRTAYDAAHAADPEAMVGLAAQSNHVNWIEQTIEAGAADHFDYITLHPYEVLNVVDAGAESVYMNIVPTLRKMLA